MQVYQDNFKIVYVVNEYSYGLYKEQTIGEFDNVIDALKAKTSNCRVEVELRSIN